MATLLGRYFCRHHSVAGPESVAVSSRPSGSSSQRLTTMAHLQSMSDTDKQFTLRGFNVVRLSDCWSVHAHLDSTYLLSRTPWSIQHAALGPQRTIDDPMQRPAASLPSRPPSSSSTLPLPHSTPSTTGCGKKSSPLMVFANFSAVVPEFKVKFGTLVSSSNLHLTAKYHLISFQFD